MRLSSVVITDLRSARWGKGIFWTLILAWFAWLLIFLAFVAPGPATRRILSTVPCRPNGSFDPTGRNGWSPFDIQDIFQITTGFGSLTFSQAKAIDMVWDVVVGRLGQAMLAFFLWKAFSAHARNCVQKGPVTFATFWLAFMDTQPSLQSTILLIRDFVTKPSRQSTLSVIFLPLAMFFVIAFPTLASAMTGYSARTEAFVTDAQQNLVPLSSFILAGYTIHDGSEIGLANDYVVPFSDESLSMKQIETLYGGSSYRDRAFNYCASGREVSSACFMSKEISDYAQRYGFWGLSNVTGAFMSPQLFPNARAVFTLEPLNISAFYVPVGGLFFGHDWIDPRTETNPFGNYSRISLMVRGTSNNTYSPDYIYRHGSCQPLETYQWGFSFLQAFIISVLLMVWSVGTYLIWLKAHLSLRQHADATIPTRYQAALLLASGVEIAFLHGEKTSSEYDVATRPPDRFITKELDGGRIAVADPEGNLDFCLWEGLFEWIKKNKWWFTGLAGLTLSALVLWWPVVPFPLYISCWIMDGGLVFALAVGSTPRTRLVFVMCGALVAAIATLIASSLGYWLIKDLEGHR